MAAVHPGPDRRATAFVERSAVGEELYESSLGNVRDTTREIRLT